MENCELGIAIVQQAVIDWRNLIRAKAWKHSKPVRQTGGNDQLPSPRCNFAELRRFFTGDWCDTIFVGAGISAVPERMLKILEAELAEAIRKDEEREARKRGQKTM